MEPLLSWDIFQEGLDRRIELAKDLQALQKVMKSNHWHNLEVAPGNVLIWQNKVIVITDTQIKIIFATENLYRMTGYKPEDVIGHSPKMFQGPETTAEERAQMRTAIDRRRPFDTVVTNHRKNGTAYKCRVEGYPIFNGHDRLVNFIAFESVV